MFKARPTPQRKNMRRRLRAHAYNFFLFLVPGHQDKDTNIKDNMARNNEKEEKKYA
jgi:hypothetical protein